MGLTHNNPKVQKFLRIKFGEQLIATHGPVERPTKSPDLTLLDFFFGGDT